MTNSSPIQPGSAWRKTSATRLEPINNGSTNAQE